MARLVRTSGRKSRDGRRHSRGKAVLRLQVLSDGPGARKRRNGPGKGVPMWTLPRQLHWGPRGLDSHRLTWGGVGAE